MDKLRQIFTQKLAPYLMLSCLIISLSVSSLFLIYPFQLTQNKSFQRLELSNLNFLHLTQVGVVNITYKLTQRLFNLSHILFNLNAGSLQHFYDSATSTRIRAYSFDRIFFIDPSEIAPYLDLPAPLFEKWFIEKLPTEIQNLARPYIPAILNLCEKHQVDPFLVTALIHVESSFKIKAKSKKGAFGLMQLMPLTEKDLIEKMNKSTLTNNLNNPSVQQFSINLDNIEIYQNLDLGIFYLKNLLEKFNYNLPLSLLAYNYGPNSHKVANITDDELKSFKYLNKILNLYEILGSSRNENS